MPKESLHSYNHGRKSWDTGVFEAFLKCHISNTSSHPTNIVGRVYPEFFSSFNTV